MPNGFSPAAYLAMGAGLIVLVALFCSNRASKIEISQSQPQQREPVPFW